MGEISKPVIVEPKSGSPKPMTSLVSVPITNVDAKPAGVQTGQEGYGAGVVVRLKNVAGGKVYGDARSARVYRCRAA